MVASPERKPRVSRREREMRRIRIIDMAPGGFTYEAIGPAGNLSRERVRRIVVESCEKHAETASTDARLLQGARLEPALRLAARAIADGDLAGIDRLIKVLDRLDKCGVIASLVFDYDARRRLFERINRAAAYLPPPEDSRETPNFQQNEP